MQTYLGSVKLHKSLIAQCCKDFNYFIFYSCDFQKDLKKKKILSRVFFFRE